MRVLFLLALWAGACLYGHCIVFVHLGSSLPKYLFYTVAQARKFNAKCPIYLIAEPSALRDIRSERLHRYDVICVETTSLQRSLLHQSYKDASPHSEGNLFWIYTSERFFYLEELVRQHQLTDVFHLENDVLLFIDLAEILPLFYEHYAGKMGVTFENDHRGVGGFMYIAEPSLLSFFCTIFPKGIAEGMTDMETLGRFKEKYHHQYLECLPILPPSYARDHALTFHPGQISQEPESFSYHFEEFQGIFDAASWGIYLAGWDSQFHVECHPGIVSPYCVFNPSFFELQWRVDGKGRRAPYVTYQGETFRLFNLHMTNKSKLPFFSLP